MTTAEPESTLSTKGIILHRAAWYDFLLWFASFGQERKFREKVLRLARLEPGESVLDVGCGTGTLAIIAKRQVGPAGAVHGIDASAEMVNRATAKACKANVAVTFQNALAEALPFPDAHFDAVVTTVMLHHLPKKTRQQCACEIRRVLKPGGRVLAVDFSAPVSKSRSVFGRIHRHGKVDLGDLIALFSDAGLSPVESGAVGISSLHFVLARKPANGSKP